MQKCSLCKKAFENKQYSPFCSKRCADIDLGKWLTESYVIEGNDANISEEDIESDIEKNLE